MSNARANDKAFQHYAIIAGENKGDSPKFNQKSELSTAINCEIRNGFLATRYGSSVITTDPTSGYPAPVSGNPYGHGVFLHKYGSPTNYAQFTIFGTSIYNGLVSTTAIETGLDASAYYYEGQAVGDIFYFTNGKDEVKYFDPDRSTSQLFSAGFDTPPAFSASVGTGGAMGTGVYNYYVTWFDENTESESNIQDNPVTVTVTSAGASVTLSDLPICDEDRVSHWVIYRQDPLGYRAYEIDRIPYDALGGYYTDVESTTGTEYVAPLDNIKPDVSTGFCLHGKVMIYFSGDTLTWSKDYRYQSVPTYNRERLQDTSSGIQRVVSFRDDVAVVFKSDSIYVVLGDLNGAYAIKGFSKERGTLSPKSVLVTSTGIYFLDSNGRPRFITPSDFNAQDLRDDSDISYKFSKRFAMIPPSQYSKCFATKYESPNKTQYRLFVPIYETTGPCDFCFMYDEALAQSNGGASAWFAFNYAIKATSAVFGDIGNDVGLFATDDYGMVWKLEDQSTFSDGAAYFFEEGESTITYGAGTITISGATFGVDQLKGIMVTVFDPYTYRIAFRTRVTTNTGTELTCQDAVPSTLSTNAAICVGGYISYAVSASFTHNHVGINRPWRLSQFFDVSYPLTELQSIVVYDYADIMNYTYSYINNPANESLTPLADNYSYEVPTSYSRYDTAIYDADSYTVAVGFSVPAYDQAIYGSSNYGAVQYGDVAFFLRNKYYFKSAAFGVASRKPDAPFGYGGGTFLYQPIGAVL